MICNQSEFELETTFVFFRVNKLLLLSEFKPRSRDWFDFVARLFTTDIFTREGEERKRNFIGSVWRLQVYYAFGTHCIEFQMLFTELYIFIAWQFPRKLVLRAEVIAPDIRYVALALRHRSMSAIFRQTKHKFLIHGALSNFTT